MDLMNLSPMADSIYKDIVFSLLPKFEDEDSTLYFKAKAVLRTGDIANDMIGKDIAYLKLNKHYLKILRKINPIYFHLIMRM